MYVCVGVTVRAQGHPAGGLVRQETLQSTMQGGAGRDGGEGRSRAQRECDIRHNWSMTHGQFINLYKMTSHTARINTQLHTARHDIALATSRYIRVHPDSSSLGIVYRLP